jgi:hypothetical protein
MSCPCSCTYTSEFPDGTEETYASFNIMLKDLKERGYVLGDGNTTGRRNTEECPCKCYNCVPREEGE